MDKGCTYRALDQAIYQMAPRVTDDIKYLPIYGDADMDKLKAAKDALGLSFLVKVVHVESFTFSRVLAWGVEYPWLGDYATVGGKTSQEGLQAALGYVLGLTDDPRATTVVGTLTKVFGSIVKELDTEDLTEETRATALRKLSWNLKLEQAGDGRDGRYY